MNFLQRLFGKKAETPVATAESEPLSDIAISGIKEELFVDRTPPEAPKETIKPSELALFISDEHSMKGFSDGYNCRTADVLDNNIKLLRAQFRLIVDGQMEKARKALSELKQHKIESKGISSRLDEGVDLMISEMEDAIIRLEGEKELSAEDEGMIAKVIHSYREGYTRGLERYRLEKFIAGSTGLFNQ